MVARSKFVHSEELGRPISNLVGRLVVIVCLTFYRQYLLDRNLPKARIREWAEWTELVPEARYKELLSPKIVAVYGIRNKKNW
jgi:hypothetical protein